MREAERGERDVEKKDRAVQAKARTFLDPAVIARLGTLELKARTIVEGLLSGLHQSPFKGFSVEFAEYRQYIHGDDLSTIDWKVFARSDRYYIKKFEEETNLNCHLLLDVSGSMAYRSRDLSKFDYAACLAASLGYLMSRQRDGVGLMAFDDRIVSAVPASTRPGHLKNLLVALTQVHPGSRTDVVKPFRQVAEALSRRGMVIVISDLLGDPEAVVHGLKLFHHRGSDVLVFHILDPDEIDFPFDRATRFEDLETGEEVMAVPDVVRAHYQRAIGDLIERYRRELGGAGIDYQLLNTKQPLEMALLAYLSTRARAA
jgi:uncharacterized protein (DUF58 family)